MVRQKSAKTAKLFSRFTFVAYGTLHSNHTVMYQGQAINCNILDHTLLQTL